MHALPRWSRRRADQASEGRAAVEAGPTRAEGASGRSASNHPACRSTADSLTVLPSLARRDDDASDLLEITWLADELRDGERSGSSVVAYKRHRPQTGVELKLERAVRPSLGARHGTDRFRHGVRFTRREPRAISLGPRTDGAGAVEDDELVAMPVANARETARPFGKSPITTVGAAARIAPSERRAAHRTWSARVTGCSRSVGPMSRSCHSTSAASATVLSTPRVDSTVR